MTAIDRMAGIYETKLWYPLGLSVYGGFGAPSLKRLVTIVTRKIDSRASRVLDVACGPAFLGGILRHRRRRYTESMHPGGCFGKAEPIR